MSRLRPTFFRSRSASNSRRQINGALSSRCARFASNPKQLRELSKISPSVGISLGVSSLSGSAANARDGKCRVEQDGGTSDHQCAFTWVLCTST